jgi:hypothetical protein
MKDLVILAADKDQEHALKGLLSRPEALDIRPVEADIFVEPGHDPACALHGPEFLSNFANQYRYGLLIFDHQGSGKEEIAPLVLQENLNEEFSRSAWRNRARVIVLVPELETWIWSNSQHVDDVAGWKKRSPGLRPWLINQGWLQEGTVKPSRPKEAFEAALRESRKPRSASLYEQIAKMVSLCRCKDMAFLEFRKILGNWFPTEK